ncbi:hypothetical protein F2Q69_00004035 [Brassica cretica]|uniref:Uncharacterized protein n=1 Tax=Brassica cretica TaxID=69181 RepID=A0A8S9NTU0_BRACR|nr:hypothetical protein F2Q69_00004035 [Brassica cretica]
MRKVPLSDGGALLVDLLSSEVGCCLASSFLGVDCLLHLLHLLLHERHCSSEIVLASVINHCVDRSQAIEIKSDKFTEHSSIYFRWLEMFSSLIRYQVDYYTELISRNFNVSTGYLVRHISKSEYEVRGKEGVLFCVDLDAKTCSWLELDMLCIPFGHVVAAAINSKRRVDVLVGEELSRNNWAGGLRGGIGRKKWNFTRCGGKDPNRATCKMPI